jgi:hypothetical protein
MVIDGVPKCLFGNQLSIFIRNSYVSIRKLIEEAIADCQINGSIPALLVTGVPGIGKSLFLIYFLISSMLEEGNASHKSFSLEFNRGVYHKITFCGLEKKLSGDSVELTVSVEEGCDPNVHHDILLADIARSEEPRKRARYTCIFSSPDRLRYKEKMKCPTSYKFTMPTWSEEELLLADSNRTDWYDRFTLFGGVPRQVFGVRKVKTLKVI